MTRRHRLMSRHDVGPRSLRARIAEEAARLLYEEGVAQYLTAKRRAARTLLGRAGARGIGFRPSELPSNGEIREALLRRATWAEGPARTRRLFAMRIVALETMEALSGFSPRLIGSVSTGHVRRGSDIDLHVFVDGEPSARHLDVGPLLRHLDARGMAYDVRRVRVRLGGTIREFTHVDLQRGFGVELSVYARAERFVVRRSSTDGKPIDRMSPARLRGLIEREHPQAWEEYRQRGALEDLPAILEAEEHAPGPYDGWRASIDA